MARRRAFTDEENEAIRTFARRLVGDTGTQAEAAKRLDISQGALSQFLLGKTGASEELADKLAVALGVSVESLSARSGPVRELEGSAAELAALKAKSDALWEQQQKASGPEKESLGDEADAVDAEVHRAINKHAQLVQRARLDLLETYLIRGDAPDDFIQWAMEAAESSFERRPRIRFS